MAAGPEITWAQVAAFVRQLTHDVRNGLNSIDLETTLLREFVTGEEGQATLERLHRQSRSIEARLRSLSAVFHPLHPVAAPIAARELLLIWREQHAALSHAPETRWVDELGGEIVSVDVEMIAAVFRELLENAAAFSIGEPLTVIASAIGGEVIFELREPKREVLDTSSWEQPFYSTRRGGYGLGLWTAKRLVEASGATMVQASLVANGGLATRIALPRL